MDIVVCIEMIIMSICGLLGYFYRHNPCLKEKSLYKFIFRYKTGRNLLTTFDSDMLCPVLILTICHVILIVNERALLITEPSYFLNGCVIVMLSVSLYCMCMGIICITIYAMFIQFILLLSISVFYGAIEEPMDIYKGLIIFATSIGVMMGAYLIGLIKIKQRIRSEKMIPMFMLLSAEYYFIIISFYWVLIKVIDGKYKWILDGFQGYIFCIVLAIAINLFILYIGNDKTHENAREAQTSKMKETIDLIMGCVIFLGGSILYLWQFLEPISDFLDMK